MAAVELVGAAVAIVVDPVAGFLGGLDTTDAIAPLWSELPSASTGLGTVDTGADAAALGGTNEARLNVSRFTWTTFVDLPIAIVIHAVAMVGSFDVQGGDATSIHERRRLTEWARSRRPAQAIRARTSRRSALRHREIEALLAAGAVRTGRPNP